MAEKIILPDLHGEEHIPYLYLAIAEVTATDSPRVFIESLFPGATEEQIGLFTLHSIGMLHEGLIMGINAADGCSGDVTEPDAWLAGYQAGLNERAS